MDKDSTVIVEGAEILKLFLTVLRLSSLKIETTTSEFDREKTQERLAKL